MSASSDTAGSAKDVGLDLNACDREPIHIPGAIQPHGLLLVADAASLTIVAGAGDLEGRLTPDWLGRDLSTLLAQDVVAIFAANDTVAGVALAGQPVAGLTERFDVTLHRSPEHVLVELEPVEAEPVTAAGMLGRLNAMAMTFERASNLQALCERAATAFRQLTGFDRVMVYRFLDDEAGRVMAEDKVTGLGTFLNHHFPASDIPKQARALYVRNRTRTIPTIDYVPAVLRPAGFETLDLSDVALRSVSPIHLRYLANMGVAASASISIVKDGLLWGLIACHHGTPKGLTPDIRAASATLAGGLARQIRAKEEAETYRERLRLRAAEDAILPKLAAEPAPRSIVTALRDELRKLMDGDGFAFVQGHIVDTDGACPSNDDILDLAAWARTRGGIDPFATHELPSLFPRAESYRAQASGLLALALVDEGAILLWFRAEQIEEVEWAGNPHKAVSVDPNAMLTPRTSFESWTQAVSGRSRRWTREEIEAAHRLRRAFHDAHINQRLRLLNADLQRTLADKDALIAQKDVLMKEVNHRVQNSLQLVAAFLSLQAKSSDDAKVKEHLAEAQARLAAVALVHRRLYRDDQVESVDLSRYIEELAGDMKTSLGDDWAGQMTLDLAPVLVATDRAVNIGLVLTELVINASKYAYRGDAGPIHIVLEQHRNRLRLIVADHGVGKSGTRIGFGSRMMTAIVAGLSGTIEQDDNMPGLRVILTAPVDDVR
ncbi:histidine kinase dimerization/phosphoacceptor domain -containing protein [Sphingomonas sp. OK281]|uniref:histidine kinase dimerization/phosphoacceptor domain -containing protein n=1 Tax=Sphingomonas sp. OK281 TaxID=1881067 RepID=UPI0008E64BC0|nr:histidine kinase dimerization/phosphoacceptor domain -containing protein [Sphingomonas sp. OK281]SFO04439.1 Bacteriophytochrome (light-regulated signal transduction histidine kinase) [Sphingomonas sp. OK281]